MATTQAKVAKAIPRYLTAADVAKATGYAYGTVRDLAAVGEIPIVAIVGKRAPLFEEAAIEILRARKRPSNR